MIRFTHIEFLWGLAIIPVLLILFLMVRRWKKRAIANLGDQHIVKRMIPEVSFSRPWLKLIFLLVAYASLIVGMSGPQIGTKMEEVERKGIDLMVLLDVSNSMLAQDIVPSRLENAKRSISRLIDNLHSDRLGMIVFAGQAYVQLPITTDYAAAKLFLNTINTDMVPTQGTAIGAAIELGMKSFDFDNGMSKAMIIITDGENHEDDAVAAAKMAQEKGVTVHVVGVGSQDGAPIPMFRGGQQVGFHTDKDGNTVVSKLNEEVCKEIASAGNGVYTRTTNAGNGLDIVMNQINKMQKKTYESKTFNGFEERFQFFLGFCFLLLVIEFFVSNRKNLRLSRLKLFD